LDADFFFRPPPDFRFDGTLAPFFRASESPIAIACFRLFTLPPLPPLPLLSVPFLRFFIARSTLLLAAFPYFLVLFLAPFFFRVAMSVHPQLDGWSETNSEVRVILEAIPKPHAPFRVVLLAGARPLVHRSGVKWAIARWLMSGSSPLVPFLLS
jgi:hypothetical protein